MVEENLTPLPGKRASEQMNLITVYYDNIANVQSDSVSERLMTEYSNVFNDELGSLPDQLHLQVDLTIKLLTAPAGRIPVSMIPPVNEELKRLQNFGVITPVNEPTDWNSRMVIAAKKSGSICICVDPRPPKKALKRDWYQLPTIEVLPKLSNAKYITKVDGASVYLHVMLHNESSLLPNFRQRSIDTNGWDFLSEFVLVLK